jgi:hypothetical protein
VPLRAADPSIFTAVLFAAAGSLSSCTRHADIADDPEGGIAVTPRTPLDDGTRVELDAGFETDAFTPCSERNEGPCRGVNDFPCDFERWVAEVGDACQVETGCVTNGWLEVRMNAEGCVASASMSEPNDAFAACVIARFGAQRCPCGEDVRSTFLGIGNDGCDDGPPPCSTGEFPCGPNEECVDGTCVPVP